MAEGHEDGGGVDAVEVCMMRAHIRDNCVALMRPTSSAIKRMCSVRHGGAPEDSGGGGEPVASSAAAATCWDGGGPAAAASRGGVTLDDSCGQSGVASSWRFWMVDTASHRNVTGFNEGKPWTGASLDMYRDCTSEGGEFMCDFHIVHEPSGRTFGIPLAFVFSKCSAVRAQFQSGVGRGPASPSTGQGGMERGRGAGAPRGSITITAAETADPNVVHAIVLYLFTGFLIDPSVTTDLERLDAEGAAGLSLSFSVMEVYRVARFLQIDTLLADINRHLVDIYPAHRSSPKLVMLHVAGLIYVAQVCPPPSHLLALRWPMPPAHHARAHKRAPHPTGVYGRRPHGRGDWFHAQEAQEPGPARDGPGHLHRLDVEACHGGDVADLHVLVARALHPRVPL